MFFTLSESSVSFLFKVSFSVSVIVDMVDTAEDNADEGLVAAGRLGNDLEFRISFPSSFLVVVGVVSQFIAGDALLVASFGKSI